MIEPYVRPFFQRISVDPFLHFFSSRFSSQQITYLACLTGITIIPVLMLGLTYLACALVLISGYLDMLDGSVARFSGQSSSIGTMLDIVSDRIVEFSIILGLFFVDPQHRGLMALLMLGSCFICVTSFLVVAIFIPNRSHKGFFYSPGIIERAEAFIFFLAMILYPNSFNSLALLFSGLVLLTSYIRVKHFIIKN